MSTSELITECMAGNEASIQVLVRTYQRAVFQLALSILDCADADLEETAGQAETATRETFVAALDRLGRYRAENQFETWLFGIAVQVSRRQAARWRSQRGLRKVLGRLAPGMFSPSKLNAEQVSAAALDENVSPEAQDRAQRDETMWRAICALPERLRLPMILRYYHDFSIEQIAHMLHTSEGAVHARLDRAREMIAANPEFAIKAS